MSARGIAIVGVIAVVALGMATLIDRDVRDSLPGGVEPLPRPTRADFRTIKTAEGAKYWPRSAPLEQGVEYRFNTGHCGLGFMTDFDASFWEAAEDATPPDFYISEDTGTIEVVSEDEAVYRSSDGATATLTRLDGPLVTEEGCA